MNRMIVAAATLGLGGILGQFSSAQALPATRPAGQMAIPTDQNGMQLRALPAVLDAREKRTPWHTAAQQAADRIQDPALRDQFNRRITGLVPLIAKTLIAQPQEDALVTVAVYRNSAQPDKQAMIAVTFNGLGANIGQTFFANVVAGLPKPPEADGIPKSLTLDTEATSYIVFFLGKNELDAGDIPHSVMGRSVVAATNRDREHGEAGLASAQAAAARVPASPVPTRVQADQTDVAHPEVGDAIPNDQYVIPQGYGPVNDGYYYPSAIGVPIVILPGENGSSPDMLARQRRRQLELEKRYRQNANSINATPQSATGGNRVQAVPPTADHSISGTTQSKTAPPSQRSPSANKSVTNPPANHVTPQSGNSNTPQSGNTNTPQSPNHNTPQSGNQNKPESGNHTTPAPAPHPAAPPATPPAGAPGGPPAAGAGKK